MILTASPCRPDHTIREAGRPLGVPGLSASGPLPTPGRGSRQAQVADQASDAMASTTFSTSASVLYMCGQSRIPVKSPPMAPPATACSV